MFGSADTDPGVLLRDADAAMYRAKDNGSDNVVVFTDGMHHHARHRVEMAGGLRRTLERNEITVHYKHQPSTSRQAT